MPNNPNVITAPSPSTWTWGDASATFPSAPTPAYPTSYSATESGFASSLSNLDALLGNTGYKKRKKSNLIDPSGLLKPICALFGVTSHSNMNNKHDTAFGIEVENEFKDDCDWPRVTDWTMHPENSLRHNGFEYVSKPLKPDKVEKSVRRLCQRLKETELTPTNSIRTSIHAHLDCTNLNYIEVLTFASVYWILEGFLSYFAGQHRIGNLFCLRLKDATMMAHVIKEAVRQYDCQNMAISENHYRYASVNFASLARFGTLEFRLMRGTLDADEIMMWIEALHQIRTFAIDIENPKKLHKFLLDGCTADEFPRIVFGKKLFEALNKFNKDDVATLVRDGVESVQNILTSHPSFNFDKELKELEEQIKKEEEEYAARRVLSGNYNTEIIVASVGFDPDTNIWHNLIHNETHVNHTLQYGVVFDSNEDI